MCKGSSTTTFTHSLDTMRSTRHTTMEWPKRRIPSLSYLRIASLATIFLVGTLGFAQDEVASIPSPDSTADTTQTAQIQTQTPQPPQPDAPAPQRGFFTRLGHAYLDDWTVDSNGAPACPRTRAARNPRPLELATLSRSRLADRRNRGDRRTRLRHLSC
jgi:hypothetical protein